MKSKNTVKSSSKKGKEQDPEKVYTLYEKVGKGAFGEVFRILYTFMIIGGEMIETKERVAIKIIDLEAAQDDIDDIQAEIHIMSQLDNPHVTKYFGSYIKGSKLWIVMEFCAGGSCSDLVTYSKLLAQIRSFCRTTYMYYDE
jgi:serine/threonine protein kinase